MADERSLDERMFSERGQSLLGQQLTLTVGPVAHGGHCVSRVGDEAGARVVFVRHALPGERVVAVVTQDGGGSFCRADAVEVLEPSADRVASRCAHAGPGGCGGCDWQHVSIPAQRQLKAHVVAEQFARLAGLQLDVVVEALPGDGLGWRTRTSYATTSDGRLGLHRHRSHDVHALDDCPLGAPGVADPELLSRRWPGVTLVDVAVGADRAGGELERSVLVHSEPPAPNARPADRRRTRRHSRGGRPREVVTQVEGPAALIHTVLGRTFRVSPGSFWQVHPAAAEVLASAVLGGLVPRAGERVLDLYAGAGLFTSVLADAVGPTGTVLGIEADRQAVADAALNLAGRDWARVERGVVDAQVRQRVGTPVDLVVLDPPRAGAGADLITALVGCGARAIGYVSCDPASLARDVAAALARGWRLTRLRAFDAFPMTQHIECVAVLEPT